MLSHLSSVILGLMAFVLAIKTVRMFGGLYRNSFKYTLLAIILLVSSHLVELIIPALGFSGEVEDTLTHILFNLGMLSLMVSYYTLMKSFEESLKAFSNVK